ncbi:hypothetical protein [Xanthomonas hortorum]|uniref:hypothetical protein n=1 Tax=Xanthomonas hortorum TaxID=56454 RepID=UPI0029362F46|nr:hypothetical protein [Xanthomonas hortorum]MDV2453709.1 hypothetical protein [Xanthomonas hortorum NBC5720]
MSFEISELKRSKSYAMQEVHFSGGLRGHLTEQGWSLLPIPSDDEPAALVFRDAVAHKQFAEQCGAYFLGMCAKYRNSPDDERNLMEVWEYGSRDSASQLSAADSWAAISFRAGEVKDKEYSASAQFISRHLRASSARLKDISDGYHEQLRWALEDNVKVGEWFSNAPLLNIHSNFHSLATELCSARDHLARVAAIHVGAGDNIDNLARLEGWLKKSSNLESRKNPLVSLLLTELGTESSPGWLRQLGLMRNKMIHKIPMGGGGEYSSLTLDEVNTIYGPIKTIRLGQSPSSPGDVNGKDDPLIEIGAICMKLENLCRASWKLAKYPAKPLTLFNSEKKSGQ